MQPPDGACHASVSHCTTIDMSGSDRPCQVVEALGAGVAQMLRELDPALAVEDQVAKAIFMPPKLFSCRQSYFHPATAIFMPPKLFSFR